MIKNQNKFPKMIFEPVMQWFPKSAPRTTGGPRIPIQNTNLCFAGHQFVFADHQIILSGPHIGKVGEPLL